MCCTLSLSTWYASLSYHLIAFLEPLCPICPYFILDFQEFNLYELMMDRVNFFSEVEVRNWCFQVFQGLAYIHQRGFFHRDLKPGSYCSIYV